MKTRSSTFDFSMASFGTHYALWTSGSTLPPVV